MRERLPADVRQSATQELLLWSKDRFGEEIKETRTMLSRALYHIGKLAAVPLSLIPGTTGFDATKFGLMRTTEQNRCSKIVKRAKDACDKVLYWESPEAKTKLMEALRLIPASHRSLIGV